MTLTTQDLKELAEKALHENNLEAAKFLIGRALKETKTVEIKPQKTDSNLLDQGGMDLALCHYLSRFQGMQVSFSSVADYIEKQHPKQLDWAWIRGERRPRWRHQISKSLEKYRITGMLTKGTLKGSHVVSSDFKSSIFNSSN